MVFVFKKDIFSQFEFYLLKNKYRGMLLISAIINIHFDLQTEQLQQFRNRFELLKVKWQILRVLRLKEILKMDVKIFNAINRISGRFAPLDLLMILISNKARYVFLFTLAAMWLAKGPARRTAKKAAFASLLALVLNRIIKLFYFKPRPFVRSKVGILIPSKRDSTFPSKHTVLVFAASVVIRSGNRFIGRVLCWLSALTGFSRIWAGHHYPSDIIGSALIGSAVGWITDRCFKMDSSEEKEEFKKM
ncbi:PAP2 superfamily protein [Cytobacillus oceanisediminis]|uniref:PAP2 superfamily protein n=2 Tax=Cytobacillus oceanisediminis TaxID=665099 RepID=A0A2V3A1X7_9BACI|nr:PAP2 superfamily protein [Cytobacillus oceanisediminis]